MEHSLIVIVWKKLLSFNFVVTLSVEYTIKFLLDKLKILVYSQYIRYLLKVN